MDLVKKLTENLDSYMEYYSIIRLETIKSLLAEFDKKSFFYVQGVSGSGKSSFKTVINNGISENTHIFEFHCSEITELDDIFFSFYKFMLRHPLKHDIFRSQKSSFKSTSIDEQVIYYLKHSPNNVLLEFDNFEKMLNENGVFKAENVKSFFEFLSTIQSVKTMFYSSRPLTGMLDIDKNIILNIKIRGLDEQQIKDFFKIFKADIPSTMIKDAYRLTGGYLYSLKFLVLASNILELPISSLLKETESLGKKLNPYLAKKIMTKIPKDARKALVYMSFFRHEVNENTLKTVEHFTNISQEIKILKEYMLIEGNTEYEIRDYLRTFLYDSIPVREKAKLHEKIADFYANQIPMKPNERVIEISRTSMYSEKFYHYNLFTKLSQNTDTKFQKYEKQEQKTANRPDSSKIQYIASTKYFPDFDLKKVSDEEFQKEKDSLDETEINLSDEEKALLNENNDIDEEENISGDDYSYTAQYEDNYSPEEFFDNPEDMLPEADNELVKAEELLQKGIELSKGDDLNEAVSYIKTAMSLFQNKDDEKFYNAKLTLARVMIDNYHYDEAKNHLSELLNYDLPKTIATDVMLEQAAIFEFEDKPDDALNQYNKMINFVNENNILQFRAKIYFHIALIYDDKNNVEKALYHYLLAATDASEFKDNTILASAYSNIAGIYEEREDFAKAIEYYRKSRLADQMMDNYEGQAKTLSSIGHIFLNTNRIKFAVNVLIKAAEIAKKTKDNYMIASAYLELGDAFLQNKDYKNALKAYFLAKKNIDNTISTDSKNKIERRFDMIVSEIGESAYNFLLSEIRKK